jgi:hypothetical protein
VVRYLASFAMTAVATVVAVGIDRGVSIPNLSLIFVVPVIIAVLAFGLGASLCSAVLGALAYNFFLTEPRYTLDVNDPADIWAIGLLFLVGLIVSGVAYTSRRRASDAALLRRQATVLPSAPDALVDIVVSVLRWRLNASISPELAPDLQMPFEPEGTLRREVWCQGSGNSVSLVAFNSQQGKPHLGIAARQKYQACFTLDGSIWPSAVISGTSRWWMECAADKFIPAAAFWSELTSCGTRFAVGEMTEDPPAIRNENAVWSLPL